jgi:phage shock protein PspC (stress-responsive transcriptional regulator)
VARKFRKAPNGWLGGVSGGLAYTLGAPVWLVRLALFLLCWIWGVGLVAYILLWIFAPRWTELPADFDAVTGD